MTNGRRPPPIQFDFDFEKAKPLLLLGALLVLVVGIALTSFFQVGPEGQSVVKRFGKVVGIKGPGLHMKMPFGIDRVTFVETERIQTVGFGVKLQGIGIDSPGLRRAVRAAAPKTSEESLMLTGDLNVIEVKWVVHYKINDADKWLHQVKLQQESIRDVSEAVMRRAVGNQLGSYVLTRGRSEIAAEVKAEMQRILDSDDPESYNMGVDIEQVELQDTNPPAEVRDSFDDVNKAQAEKKRLVYNADKLRKELTLSAKGEASRLISEAEGYSASVTNAAWGAVARFNAIHEQYKAQPDVTRQRMYLESVGAALQKAGKVLVVEEGGTAPIPFLNLEGTGGPLK